MLPVTRRSTVVVGGSGCGEKGDNGDSNSCGEGGCDSESSGGPSASGGVGWTPRSGGIRNTANTVNTGDDDSAGSNASSRKSLTVVLEPRQSRAQGIRKLQKCLSTTTNHYELDSSSLNNFPTTSLLSSHRSTEIRSYSSTTPQASFNYQNILSNTRQYNSFGSIIQ